MKSGSSFQILAAAIVCVLVNRGGIAQAQTPSFRGIGGSAGYNYTEALGISDDGLVVAGATDSAWSGNSYAFRWVTSALPGYFEYCGALPGSFSLLNTNTPQGISADGSVLVGTAGGFVSGGGYAFYWTPTTGMQFLDPLLGRSGAFGVSADGSIVTGSNENGVFRWSHEGGIEYLGAGAPSDISADGSVIVGHSGSEAFRWTQGTGMVGLGDLPGGAVMSQAHAVSPDGSAVVGISWSDTGAKAFLWTQATGMVDLGILPEPPVYYSEAYGVSNDGSIVVGYSSARAFIWDSDNGMRALQDVLTGDFGLDLTGWTLTAAHDITPDGHTIVGAGINPEGRSEGWIAVIPGLVRPVEATINFDPDVLNLRSHIPQVTCSIGLPSAYSVTQIEPGSIVVADEIKPAAVHIEAEQGVVILKLDRSELAALCVPGEVILTVSGTLVDGTKFKGTGTFLVRD